MESIHADFKLTYLNKFQVPRRVVDELELFYLDSNRGLKIFICSVVQLNARKQISNQTQEEWFIFIDLKMNFFYI